MQLVKNTTLTITGHREQDVKHQLDYYYDHSNLAQTLFIAAAGKKVEIKLKQAGTDFQTSKGEVSISWAVVKQQNPIKELCESAIFEIHNGVQKDEFSDANSQLSNGTNTLILYGENMARLESKSTVGTARILLELMTKGYSPSLWGRKQILTYSQNKGNFEEYFINAKHDDKATQGLFAMKSKYMYAFEKIHEKSIKGIRQYVNKITPDTITGGLANTQFTTRDLLRTLYDDKFGKYTMSLGQFLVSYIYGIEALKSAPNWTISFSEHERGGWVHFADNIVACIPTVARNQANEQDIVNAFNAH